MSNVLVLGKIINPQNDHQCDYYPLGAMLLTADKSAGKLQYKIKAIGHRDSLRVPRQVQVLDYSDHIILPGFYDMHFHWVQDDVRLMPKASLLHWLKQYTFPAEKKFEKADYAKKKAVSFFKKLTQSGTVGGACYSSIHSKALDYAMAQAKGNFVIGNVTMTINGPDFLTQKTDSAVKMVARALAKYGKRYVFTPRFAIATDPVTMSQAAKLTNKAGAFIQTHLSENVGEIKTVMKIYKDMDGFEDVQSYTDIYHRCGILGPRTIMGHAIHLSDKERQTLAKTKTAIAHCPSSNAPVSQNGLGSGLFDFASAEKAGIRWALASDIGGGPFLSMFDVMRSFLLQNQSKGRSAATAIKALYRSTLAGAEILKLDKKFGNLNPGKFADFILVKSPKQKSNADVEQVLRQLILAHKNNRKKYDSMVDQVYLKGIKQ